LFELLVAVAASFCGPSKNFTHTDGKLTAAVVGVAVAIIVVIQEEKKNS